MPQQFVLVKNVQTFCRLDVYNSCSLQSYCKMDMLNKKIASFYKLLANQNRFLNKEVQRPHFLSLWIMPLEFDLVLIVVKLSCTLES